MQQQSINNKIYHIHDVDDTYDRSTTTWIQCNWLRHLTVYPFDATVCIVIIVIIVTITNLAYFIGSYMSINLHVKIIKFVIE